MIVWTILAVACVAYWIVIAAYSGISTDFAWIWLALAVGLGAMGQLGRAVQTHAGWVRGLWHTGIVLCVIAVLFVGVLTGIVLRGMHAQGEKNLDYVVVLGAHVKKTVPSRALLKRLQRAQAYAEQNPDTVLIVTGGQGTGEEITEAECMAEWLIAHGIAPERIVREDQSTTTYENLRFADRLTGCADKRTGILSNDFHVARALKIARKAGYQECVGIAAAGDAILETHYILREDFALIKAWLTKTI